MRESKDDEMNIIETVLALENKLFCLETVIKF